MIDKDWTGNIGGVTISLHNGDALEFLSTVSDATIDTIFFDAPFYQKTGKKGDKTALYRNWVDAMAGQFYRVLKDGGNVVYVNAPKYILATAETMLKRFDFRSEVPLLRRGSLRPAWMLGFRHNLMLLLCKGDKKKKWCGATKNHDKSFPTDVWDDIPYQNGFRSRYGWHPEAINIEVVQRAVDLCVAPGDTVLDPCMGAATTAIACINRGANFIGNEIREDYYSLSLNRIKEKSRDLFLI